MSFGKKSKAKHDLQNHNKMCKKCINLLEKKKKKESMDKSYLKIDKTQVAYDEAEIDYINDHQSKIYISYVDINPYAKFGIRAHYDQLTFAHCIHSMFISINHKDFILIWIHFIPAMFMLWQLFSLEIGFNHFYNFS